MASAYKQLRCPGCDGTLRYIKEKKIWECIYCGNEIRREEEYDGLYTIKNVVRMVLVDLAYQRMDSAVRNLVECQKISSDYVGTLIAEISQKVFILMRRPDDRGMIGQVKRLYIRLESADGAPISAEEEALYESFEGNGDAFGVILCWICSTLPLSIPLRSTQVFSNMPLRTIRRRSSIRSLPT